MILLVIALLLRNVEATSQSTVYITSGAPNGTLLKAFGNSAVTNIYFKADYNIEDEFWAYAGVKPPLPVNRSITLSGATGGEKPLLDFNFQYGVLEVCSKCTFKLEHIAVANERRGTGHGFDFFVGQPGSRLVLNDTYRMRMACTQTEDALQFDGNAPRAPDYPGPPGEEKQQIDLPYGVNVTYHGFEYLDSFDVVNMAIDLPRTFQELGGPQGGFTLVILNTVRLCDHTVEHACLLMNSPEVCVNQMIDALLAPQTTMGGNHSNELTVLVATLVVGAIVAAAVVSLIIYMLRRRWRRSAFAGSAAAAGGQSATGGAMGLDLEAGPLFETYGTGSDGALSYDTNASQHMRAKGWVVTHKTTAPLLDPVQDDRIRFGMLLGAGSFGKVYRGWWADKLVAIKVIEHDQSNATTVENEEILMLSFDHPNVVRAYHCVTFTMVKTPKGSDAQGTGTTAAIASGNNGPGVASVHNSSSSDWADTAAGSMPLAALGSSGPSDLISSGAFGSSALGLRESSLALQFQQQQQQQQQEVAAGVLAADTPLDPFDGIPSTPHPAVSNWSRAGLPRPGDVFRFGSGQLQQTLLKTQHQEAGSATSSTPQSSQSHERSGRSGSSSSSDVRTTSLSNAINDLHARQQQQQTAQRQPGGNTSRRQHLQLQLQQQTVDGGSQDLQSPPHQQSISAPGGEDGQQQQHVVSPVQAVRPGSPRPDGPPSASPSPGSPRPSGAYSNNEERYICPSPPLSQRIDTSRWPGIMDYVAAKRAEQEETTRTRTWLVLEFCDLGTLSSIASDWSPKHEGDQQMMRRLMLLSDAAKGLQALHSKKVVHGDLNARNVLVSSNPSAPIGMVAKLADLGMARKMKQHKSHRTTHTVGTMSHMPPELLRYGRMSPAVDLFSFGIMMWEVYTGQGAFRALHYGQFFETVVLRNQRPHLPPGMPKDYQLLMERCWLAAPQDRPNVQSLLECLSLMITDRQQNIIKKQALVDQLRLGPPQPAAAAEDLQQQHPQHRQRRMSCPVSSPLPDSLDPAAGAVAALGPTNPGRPPKRARRPSNAMRVAHPTLQSIYESRDRSPRKLRPRRSSERPRRSSELDLIGVDQTSATMVAGLTSQDHPQQQKHHVTKQRRPQQLLVSQRLREGDLEGSQYFESW